MRLAEVVSLEGFSELILVLNLERVGYARSSEE